MPNLTRIKNNQVTDSTIVASAKLVSRSVTGGLLSDPLTYSGNMTISGNLTVQGTTTTVDTVNTLVADPVIVLSRGETGTPSNDSGFMVERGTSNNAAFLWDETNDQFVAITTTDDGMTGGAITQTAFADLKVANLVATVGSQFGNIKISGNTVESTNTNGNINITPNGSGDINLSADTTVLGDSNTQAILTTNGTGNLLLSTNNGTNSGNIVIVQGTNGNIQLTPNGTGQVLSSANITAPVFISNITTGTAPLTVTSTTRVANLNVATAGVANTVNDAAQPNITSLGNLTIVNIDNIQINNNTISSTDTNGNIVLDPNGTGNIIINDATANRVFYSGANKELITSANFTFDGTNAVIGGDLGVNGGDITTTSTGTATVFNANASTLNMGGAATTVSIGASSGTTTINNNATVTLDLAVNGGDITTTSASFNLLNANATTVNFAGAATTLEIGAATGTTNINNNLDVDGNINMDGSNFTTTAATVTIANANTTTLNIGGAATAVNIGAATGTTIIKNNLDVDGDINFDGGDITTTAVTANIVNANATTVNFAGAATTLEIGAATGTTNINNNLDVDGNINMDGGNFTTTAATVNIANATTTTLNIGGAATAVNIGATTGTTIVRNDLQINGNDIKSSTGNVAITLNNTDVTIAGNLTIQGTTTNVGTNDLIVEDSLINLHTTANLAPLTSDDGRDVGIIFHYYKTSDKEAALVWANDTGSLEYYADATETVQGTITGTYGNIKALTYTSTATNGTAPFVVNSTTLVANLRAATAAVANTVADAAQPNITSVGNLTIANIDNIQINGNTISSTNTNGNINLTPAGTGEVIASSMSVSDLTSGRVVLAGTSGSLIDNANLTFDGSVLYVSGISVIGGGAVSLGNFTFTGNTVSVTNTNGDIILDPNGAGQVKITSSTTVLGDNNTQAVLTTNGTGNLLLSTNSGTNSGNILITQGTNANITLTPNGTGNVVIGNLAIANNVLISTVTNANVDIIPNGTGDVRLLADNVVVGDSNTAATITTNGTGDLTLNTNAGTNAGNIVLTNGTNGNITITPNGTGNVVISNIAIANNNIISTGTNANINITPNGTGDINLGADTVVVGDSNTQAVVTTNGTGNLFLSTNSGTNSGNIVIAQGTNANITLTPNGTGEVVASTLAVSDLTSTRVTYAGANGALVDNANLTFSGTLLTVTGNANVTNTANIANIQISGNTIASTDTNGNINLNANGTGDVVVNSVGDNSDFYVYANTTTYTSALIYGKASSGQIGIKTESPTAGASLHINAVDSMILPAGGTGDRPGTPAAGMIRYNTSNNSVEFWDGSAWTDVTGGFTVISSDSFSGDGSTVNFTLSQSATSASVIVSINGIVQIPGSAYSVSTTTLTFTEAPVSGDEIDVRLLTTTATVTDIADLNTSVKVNDAAERANVTINGNLIMSVSNLAVLPGTDNTYNIGSGSFRWKNVYATNTTIQNADLAENYLADSIIAPGTVVSFGGAAEITISTTDMDTAVAGVVSTAPAHIMNSALEGANVVPLALQGRVPVKVSGKVRKGDMMVSAGNGTARAEANPKMGSVIGKALENFDGTLGVIEVVVGRL